MQAFTLIRPSSTQDAVAAASQPGAAYIAGGTDLLQLAKDNVETPGHLVDLEPLGLSDIDAKSDRLRLQPLARMADVAAHPSVVADWPVLSQAARFWASRVIANQCSGGTSRATDWAIRALVLHGLATTSTRAVGAASLIASPCCW